MKKLSIFLIGILGIMAASCDDAPEVAKPQVNPQEPIVAEGDVVSQPSGALLTPETSELKLQEYKEKDEPIPVMQLTETKNLPEGATISYRLELSNSETFANVQTIEALEGDDGVYYVSVDEWGAAHQRLFGKSPKPKMTYYRVPAFINYDGSNYRYVSTNYYVAKGHMQVCGVDAGFVIEDHYYLLGSMTTWTLNAESVAPYMFEHSDDVSVYDDPVFVIKFEVPADVVASDGGAYWKIAPQSAVESKEWANVVGTAVNGDTALSGTLVSENAEAGKIEVAGKYKMTINMEAMTYDIERLLQPDILYTPGGTNDWNQLNSAWMQLNSEKGYYGVFPVNGDGFKICTENSWDNAYTYGAKLADPALSGELLLGQSGQNIKVPAENEGLIWASVQFDPVSYELTTYNLIPVNRVGVIGSFAASSWGDDVEMTSADGGITWNVDVTFIAGDEYKIRFNGNWDYNLGGDSKALSLDGGNIKAEEAGNYTVTLKLQPGIPTLTLTKK